MTDTQRLNQIRQFAELSVPDRFEADHKTMVGELATMLILNPEDVDVVLPKYTEAVGWWKIHPLA